MQPKKASMSALLVDRLTDQNHLNQCCKICISTSVGGSLIHWLARQSIVLSALCIVLSILLDQFSEL